MSTATSSSSSINSFFTSNGVTRMNGSEFASGLDTQKLIDAMTAKTQAKITRQQQLEQKTEWKRDMYRDVEKLLQTFSDKYLSYAAGGSNNILSPSFFDSQALTSSNSSIITATGAARDAGNVVVNSITSLATAASSSSGSHVSRESIQSAGALGGFVGSSSYFTIKTGDTSYRISLGDGVDLSGCSTSKDAANKIAEQLNKRVAANKDLKDKISFSANDAGVFTMTNSIGATITGASQNFIDGFGMSKSGPDDAPVYALGSSATDKSKLTSLSTQLEGVTLSFRLDGVNKSITFDQSEKSQYSDASGIASYLQSKIDLAYGSDRVSVGLDADQKLTFLTKDSTSVLEIAGSTDYGVLSKNGVLRIDSGETNRTEMTKTLKDLSSELSTPLLPPLSNPPTTPPSHGEYKLTVNGKEFSFTEDTELGAVINTINNDTAAAVNISYSQTLNQFRIVADDTGTHSHLDFKDSVGGGNLAAALFSSRSSIISNPLLVATDGSYSTGSSNSSYTIAVKDSAGGTTVSTIQIPAGQSYSSLDAYRDAVQNSINGSALNGRVTVSAENNGLTFTAANSGSSLSISAADSSNDTLGIGTQSTENTYKQGADLVMNVKLGGVSQTITRTSNSVTLDGVAMNITGETTSPISFTPSSNVDDLYKKINDFVDTYNTIVEKANKYASETPAGLVSSGNSKSKVYDPLTDAQKKEMTDSEIEKWNDKAKQGLLMGDSTLNLLLSDLRSAMETSVSSVGLSMYEIGISTAPYDWTSGGKMVVDETKLKEALRTQPDKVTQLFTNVDDTDDGTHLFSQADGIATRLQKIVKNNIGMYGSSGALVELAGSDTMIGADNSELSTQISNYNNVISSLQTQLQTEKDRWQTKFSNMEQLLYRLTNQYNSLSNMS